MSADSERLAAALDEAFSDPEVMALLHSHAVQQQILATIDPEASTERDRINEELDRAFLDNGGSRNWCAHQEIPGWIRLGMLSALTAWVLGESQTCEHRPRPDGPFPGIAVAWRPGLVTCPWCVKMLDVHAPEDGMRCDGCGRISESDSGFRPVELNNGNLRFRVGACPGCLEATA